MKSGSMMYHHSEKMFTIGWDGVLFFVPFLGYIFRQRGYYSGLYAGAFIQIYFMILACLGFHFLLNWFRIKLIKKMGHKPYFHFRRFIPYSFPIARISRKQLIVLEALSHGLLYGLIGLVLGILYLVQSEYWLPMMLGTGALYLIFTRNSVRRILWALHFPHHVFRYTRKTVHVYSPNPREKNFFHMSPIIAIEKVYSGGPKRVRKEIG